MSWSDSTRALEVAFRSALARNAESSKLASSRSPGPKLRPWKLSTVWRSTVSTSTTGSLLPLAGGSAVAQNCSAERVSRRTSSRGVPNDRAMSASAARA